jgi:hypothetical protein
METRTGRTVAVAWAAALCSLALGQAAAASAAQDARQPASSMSLVVFEDVPGSEALLRGDYEAGLGESMEAAERSARRRAFQLASNVCVAQLKLGRMQAAREQCGRVAETSLDSREGRAMARRHHAVALVNQGVLLSVQGDVEAASEHFDEARRRFPALGVARSNLQRISSAGGEPSITVGEEP